MGVDGLRLDAVPYLFEREGTNCENLPDTHVFLKRLRSHIDSKFENRMLLAEANQWPSDAVAYFGNGDECHMAFHFPLMPRMFMAIQLEDVTPIVDIMDATPSIPEICQWAVFLRNHDELTLEMVTDEERDYLFKSYARDANAKINLGIRRRLAPLLDNDRKRIELMELLLVTLPGTPVIYYGDEILMGDNYNLGDRNSVRTPMQWAPTLNAGFSKANPQRLYLPLITDSEFNYETVNVENQEKNPSSHLWWIRKLISVRKNLKPLSRGRLEFVNTGNSKVLAFVRTFEKESVLVAVNLSKYTQIAQLDLSSLSGRTPVEIFGATRFPPVERSRYALTFGPGGYYIFEFLQGEESKPKTAAMLPEVQLRNGIRDIMKGEAKEAFERKILPAYVSGQPWFAGMDRSLEILRIRDCLPLGKEKSSKFQFLILDMYYKNGMPETYVLPVGYAPENYSKTIETDSPAAIITRARMKEEKGIIYDATVDADFRSEVIKMLGKSSKGEKGDLRFAAKRGISEIIQSLEMQNAPAAQGGAFAADRIVLREGLVLKLIRNPEEGVNPELEIGDLLTGKNFPNVRNTAGDITYSERGGGPLTLGILYEYNPEETNLRDLSVDDAARFLETVNMKKEEIPRSIIDASILEISKSELPVNIEGLVGTTCLERMRNLGKVSAAFHIALSEGDGNVAPKSFGYLYQVSVSYAMTTKARKILRQARQSQRFGEPVERLLNDLCTSENSIVEQLNSLRVAKIESTRIRIHGNYDLRNIFRRGENLIITDYESDTTIPMDARRIMRSPLKDIAKMQRSIHYAAQEALVRYLKAAPRDAQQLDDWVFLWYKICSAAFLGAYMEAAKESRLIPHEADTMKLVLNTFLLDECLDELGRELDLHSDLVIVPVRAMTELLVLNGLVKKG